VCFWTFWAIKHENLVIHLTDKKHKTNHNIGTSVASCLPPYSSVVGELCTCSPLKVRQRLSSYHLFTLGRRERTTMAAATDEAGEVEIQAGKCSKTPSIVVQGTYVQSESSPETIKSRGSPPDLPECAPQFQHLVPGNEKGEAKTKAAPGKANSEESKKDECFTDKAARTGKSVIGTINKINRKHRNFRRIWRSLRRPLRMLGRNANGVLAMFGLGGK